MFDLKTDAPSEIRGEFSPIGTNVSGIRICEHLPRLADRRSLLTAFDRFRRDADSSGAMTGVDAFTGQAFDILTSLAARSSR